MREIKFRAWKNIYNRMISWEEICKDRNTPMADWFYHSYLRRDNDFMFEMMQYTGLKDKNGIEIYIGDIMEFDNKDRISIEMEDFLYPYANFIGDPDCQDQVRDFYRIEKAVIIGNRFENPELMEPVDAETKQDGSGDISLYEALVYTEDNDGNLQCREASDDELKQMSKDMGCSE